MIGGYVRGESGYPLSDSFDKRLTYLVANFFLQLVNKAVKLLNDAV